ncbi:MAG: sigma-70 family RNA polymerase sigma factor [Pirellulales bacterium]|nr:sigma-70 family RNA polymerase sigma factor [Pirellulales bacterium]
MGSQPVCSPRELLVRAKRGVSEDIGRLLQTYTNYLNLLAVTQMDPKLRARLGPSDVVQETFYEAQRDFHQFRGHTEQEFMAWLRQILVNNLSRLVERHVLAAKRDVRREVSLERMRNAVELSTARLEAVLADQGASPSASVQDREHAILLADQLAEMPADHREVLVLRHLQGLPFKEVARRMDRSHGAVRMLWLRAIGSLRQRLQEKDLI